MDSDIKEEFQCNICLGVLIEPRLHIPCKKNFCSECIKNVITLTTSPCPICRSPLTSDQFRFQSQLWESIKSTNFVCQCGAILPYVNYNDHLAVCSHIQHLIKKASQEIPKPSEPVINRWTYSCPCCDLSHFDRESLLIHVDNEHLGMSGVCTICKALPWGDPEEEFPDICDHLQTSHQFDYDNFADFTMNEDEMLEQALQQSLYE
ncbi:unnamed protein product [Blepharisma stoltei]|uniref:RING-type domain-containing protein n=1 Tax=Blepharisma stoltei TaxID=1481888 RepID=A0AAU9IUY7_9CILI|nr:unnamed protein product [Blepharisma stoltei]